MFIVFGISCQLATCYEQKGLFAGAIGLSSFLMLVPFQSMKQGTMI
ncbi:hypothetical protein P869_08330 [Ligilactobacillus ruminis S23]|nr:hypothetical protein P869_08330 [Ligilactobacillus ruminis S23]